MRCIQKRCRQFHLGLSNETFLNILSVVVEQIHPATGSGCFPLLMFIRLCITSGVINREWNILNYLTKLFLFDHAVENNNGRLLCYHKFDWFFLLHLNNCSFSICFTLYSCIINLYRRLPTILILHFNWKFYTMISLIGTEKSKSWAMPIWAHCDTRKFHKLSNVILFCENVRKKTQSGLKQALQQSWHRHSFLLQTDDEIIDKPRLPSTQFQMK